MIREATIDDKFRLVEMTTRFILTTRYREWLDGATPERIGTFVDVVLEHGVIFVAESNALPAGADRFPILGMLALLVFENPLTGRLMAEEQAWWVEPEYRSGTVGPRLLHHMERWSVQKGLHMVKMVAPTDSGVGLFYAKQGYQAVETHWLRVFSDGPDDRTSDRSGARRRPAGRQEDEPTSTATTAGHGARPHDSRDE